MAHLIDKSAAVAEIDGRIASLEGIGSENYLHDNYPEQYAMLVTLKSLKFSIDNLEIKEVELYNNGWIDCIKQMPPETKQTSDTLQGHREWTESNMVLVWDSMYGCSVDVTKNGKWMSERRGGYTGQLVHRIIAWRPIPKFSEELLLKAQRGE